MHYLFYKVHARDIYMIKFLIEAYENMVQVSTVDRTMPKLQLTVAPDFLPLVEAIVADLQKTFEMTRLDEDATKSQGLY